MLMVSTSDKMQFRYCQLVLVQGRDPPLPYGAKQGASGTFKHLKVEITRR